MSIGLFSSGGRASSTAVPKQGLLNSNELRMYSETRIRRNITQAAAGNAMGVIDPKNNIHRKDTLKMSTTPPAPHEEQSWYYIVKIPRP